jgi:hypothetical protein
MSESKESRRKEIIDNLEFWMETVGPESNCTKFYAAQLKELENEHPTALNVYDH